MSPEVPICPVSWSSPSIKTALRASGRPVCRPIPPIMPSPDASTALETKRGLQFKGDVASRSVSTKAGQFQTASTLGSLGVFAQASRSSVNGSDPGGPS